MDIIGDDRIGLLVFVDLPFEIICRDIFLLVSFLQLKLSLVATMGSKTIIPSTRPLVIFALLLSSPAAAFNSSPFYLPSINCQRHHHRHHQSQLGLYRKFHERGWITLLPNDTATVADDTYTKEIPPDLRTNSSSPSKTNDNVVIAQLRSTSTFPSLASSSSNCKSVLRLARSAFLETQTTAGDVLLSPMAIHVLNFVLFPNTNIRNVKTKEYIPLPIFGADIVSLPGNKHLVVVDFQPVVDDSSSGEVRLLPMEFSAIESRLKLVHSTLQDTNNAILPWGGDIPEKAARFFSPYALWTRLTEENNDAIHTVETVVWEAFQEYLDLYIDMIRVVQQCVTAGLYEIVSEDGDDTNPVRKGQMDYLEYRRVNDPARPMLRRLYGEEWTERVIDEVLFPNL
jgi:hypothetical protein